jgi:ribonucleotide monophosphatase NagD (HAD superfamily)
MKIVAIDLDGTLLHSDCTISSYSKEVIAEAGKNGIMVVPTSGRSFRSIKNQVKDIEELSPQEELVQDIVSILHVFSCRLYGLRKYKKSCKCGLSIIYCLCYRF